MITSWAAVNLIMLTLSETQISSVPNLDPVCDTLVDLQLYRNHIVDVRNLYVNTFPKLRILNLKENKILQVHAYLMFLPAMNYISLAKNRLTLFPNLTINDWGDWNFFWYWV